MSAKIYCVCGGITEYTISKPKFCGCCGVEFVKLFTPKKEDNKNITKSIDLSEAVRKPIKPKPIFKDNLEEESDELDEVELERLKETWASLISSSDFIINADKSSVTKFKDL